MSGPLLLGHTDLPATASGQLRLPVVSLRSWARGPGTLGRKARCQRQWTRWAAPGWPLPGRLEQGRVKSRGAIAARASERQLA
jgi:hypothetical protein